MRHYRSSSKDCRQCPLKTTCIGKSNEKKIEVTVDKPLYDQMHERLQSPYAKRMKKIRSSTVEPVLGTLVNFLSMRRVNTRGLKGANKCMLMAAVAYNLKKLMKFKAPEAIAMMKKIEKQAGKGLENIFLLFTTLMMQYQMKNSFLKPLLYNHQ
jgi:hypothetical protein